MHHVCVQLQAHLKSHLQLCFQSLYSIKGSLPSRGALVMPLLRAGRGTGCYGGAVGKISSERSGLHQCQIPAHLRYAYDGNPMRSFS